MTRLTPNMIELMLLMRERGGAIGAGEIAGRSGAARALEMRGLVERGAIATETRGLAAMWRLTAVGEKGAAIEDARRALAAEMRAAHDALFRQPGRSWGQDARPCPRCGCRPDRSCEIMLADDAGSATCVPAGVFDAPECSACASDHVYPAVSQTNCEAMGQQMEKPARKAMAHDD